MLRAIAALLLVGLIFSAAEIAPSGITCCDEELVRRAMTEEALRRIADRNEGRAREETDYLCVQAHERIRGRLPAGDRGQVLDFMRQALRQDDADEDTREFQKLVSHFTLGMTLEIGHTFQFEYDQAQAARERAGRLLAELEAAGDWDAQSLDRSLFRADMGVREFRRLRALPGRWRDSKAGASPFDEFSAMRRNLTGLQPDPDQKPVFRLAADYNDRFPFLDGFLANYRRLAGEFRAVVLELNDKLALMEGKQ